MFVYLISVIISFRYVATSSKYSRGVNLSALERLKKAREQVHQSLRRENAGGQSFWIPTSPTYKQKLRMSRSLGFNVVPSKQVFFVLNGKGRYYRTLLNPLRLPPMEVLLHEVSEGLEAAIFRLYTINGTRISSVNEIISLSPPKVIACTRIERPYLGTVMLPNINNYHNVNKINKSASDSSYTTSSSVNDNGIDKKRSAFVNSMRKNTRRSTGIRKKKPVEALPAIASGKAISKVDETDSGKANSISSRTTETSKVENNQSFVFNEAMEKNLSEAEKQLITEDDDSFEDQSNSDMNLNISRTLTSSSRNAELQRKQEERLLEERLASSTESDRLSVLSEVNQEAELIEKNDMNVMENNSDLMKNPTNTSDIEENLISDDEVYERNVEAPDIVVDYKDAIATLRYNDDSDTEENLKSDDESELKKLPQIRKIQTPFSNNEKIQDDNDIEKVESNDGGKMDNSLSTSNSDEEENLPSDDEELNNREKAVIKIQSAFRGYEERKKIKTANMMNDQNEEKKTSIVEILAGNEPFQQLTTQQGMFRVTSLRKFIRNREYWMIS
ncbi:hypothetical protein DICVIV_09592 [Dictyocaulus viviparus]|uniref:Doublecortin n=1 Tax=Dictyocaulus viviparus TaxID=29172 RepID=A0A0D8XPT1_DICVI|nr:hypothetical protein DICVIV_09592 [Dictyocaulus viviparus]